MPAVFDRILTAFSAALTLFGLLIVAAMHLHAQDDPHGGSHAIAFGMLCVAVAAWLYGVLLTFRRRWWLRWWVAALPVLAFGTVATLESLMG